MRKRSALAGILEARASEYEGAVDVEGEKILRDAACVAAVSGPDVVTIEKRMVPTPDAAGAHDFSRRGREVDVLAHLAAPSRKDLSSP